MTMLSRVAQDIRNNLGYDNIILKSDQEASIVALNNAVARHLRSEGITVKNGTITSWGKSE